MGDGEDRRVAAYDQGDEEDSRRAETGSGPENPPTESHILDELLDGGRDPDRPRVLVGEGNTAKSPPGGLARVLRGLAPVREQLSLLRQVKSNLVIQIPVILRAPDH